MGTFPSDQFRYLLAVLNGQEAADWVKIISAIGTITLWAASLLGPAKLAGAAEGTAAAAPSFAAVPVVGSLNSEERALVSQTAAAIQSDTGKLGAWAQALLALLLKLLG